MTALKVGQAQTAHGCNQTRVLSKELLMEWNKCIVRDQQLKSNVKAKDKHW